MPWYHRIILFSATVLEEPELEAEDQKKEEEEGVISAGIEAEEDVDSTPKRGWVRRSVASSATHHSTELIEVEVSDYPVVTVDCSIQVSSSLVLQDHE